MYDGTDSLEYSPEPPGKWEPIKKWARDSVSNGRPSLATDDSAGNTATKGDDSAGNTATRVALEAWFLWAPTFSDLRQALRWVPPLGSGDWTMYSLYWEELRPAAPFVLTANC